MNVNPTAYRPLDTAVLRDPAAQAPRFDTQKEDDGELADAFGAFVGQTLFGQMLKAMRKTVKEPAYFHGGKAEEVFTEQLDQVLAEKMAETCSEKFSGPMFELFNLKRGG